MDDTDLLSFQESRPNCTYKISSPSSVLEIKGEPLIEGWYAEVKAILKISGVTLIARLTAELFNARPNNKYDNIHINRL